MALETWYINPTGRIYIVSEMPWSIIFKFPIVEKQLNG